MELTELYDKIGEFAMATQGVEKVTYLSPYVVWNSLNMVYGAFCAELDYVRYQDNVIEYHFIFYYGDKLKNDSSNLFELQSAGFNVIRNVVNHLIEYFELDTPEYTDIHPFNQKFADILAGAYANVVIYVPIDERCFDYDKPEPDNGTEEGGE